MNESVIVTTPAQLQSIISDAVNAILPKLADFRRKNEPVETDGMNVEDAARFLTEQGIPTTRATLYKHDPVQEVRTPHGVLEKGAAGMDRIAHRPFGGQADCRRFAYRTIC